ncbi:MAG TPA: hypothetical protein VFK56_00665 [Mycobacterium sp.]|jgi:hypothetical protein|nr:hypothetical protein [Mycobacterium sp.]
MPAAPLWLALPAHLDHLLLRLAEVKQYPLIPSGRPDCNRGPDAPDGHDWVLWRSGKFLTASGEWWPLYLRRCTGCLAVEVRKEGMRATVTSVTKPIRRGMTLRTPGPADVLLGWYQG